MAAPSIACIGIVGKSDNLLHISLFPPHTTTANAHLSFSLILSSSLDILSLRRDQTAVDQDFGLLHALDERFAVYGWLTNTGVKFLIVVDLNPTPTAQSQSQVGAKTSAAAVAGATPVVGLRDSDLKPAFRALQTAYVQLLQNPFYKPDEEAGAYSNTSAPPEKHTGTIQNRQFIAQVNRIGERWAPGVVNP